MKMRVKNAARSVLVFLGTLALSAAAVAADKPPEFSPEGLKLTKSTRSTIVYVREGASLDPYSKVALLDCYVAFKKNWARDYNRESMGVSRDVTTEDMERIKTGLAEMFREVFTEELQDKGGYAMVDKAAEDVLVIRPAIIDLDVTAPDLKNASRSRTAVASAGEMTLYMELLDSATGDLIARIIDAEGDDRNGFVMAANEVTNKAEARRIIRGWAKQLREHMRDLDATTTAKEKTAAKKKAD